MEIKELGRAGLVERYKSLLGDFRHSDSKSFGRFNRAAEYLKNGLVSSVMMMEGVDFDLVYFPLNYLGFKTVTAVSADLYGSGGVPLRLSLVVAVSKRFTVEDVDFFMKGVREACTFYGIDLLFLDFTSSLTGFAIGATVFGEKKTFDIPQKAAVTDLVCVTGDLGAAYLGQRLMAREKSAFDDSIDFQPDFAGREYLLERQLKPVVPFAVIDAAKEAGVEFTSLSVLKGGLSDALYDLAKSSGVGLRIYEKTLPIDFQTQRMAEDFGLDPSTAALHGGEDYQYLFTAPLTAKERLEAVPGIRAIGFVTEESGGLKLVGRSGGETAIGPDDFTGND